MLTVLLKYRQLSFYAFISKANNPGIHWFVVYNLYNTIEVFDSLGSSEAYLRRHFSYLGKYMFNTTPVQCKDSSTCGDFVCAFIIFRIFNIELDFQQVLNDFFGLDCETNEQTVSAFLGELQT